MSNKKMTRNLICNECTKRLKDYGFICFDILEEICKNTLNSDDSYYNEVTAPEFLSTIFALLERKGYLITTDIYNDLIVVQLDGNTGIYDHYRNVFCWCN